jgi:hypothetical protein
MAEKKDKAQLSQVFRKKFLLKNKPLGLIFVPLCVHFSCIVRVAVLFPVKPLLFSKFLVKKSFIKIHFKL